VDWFDESRLAHLLALLGFAAAFFYFIWKGRRGTQLYIRPIDALARMDDAVGRAAEMGRPLLFAPGLGSLTDPVTVAALAILSRVAHNGARLFTRTLVPNYEPLTWPVAQEVVRQSYLRAGHPDDFDPDDVVYLTSRNFTYAAATAGMMMREKTATNFFVGHFYSESLILAETGAATGALQIAGTDSVEQIPFFITTCDATMIGEEVFAASALVSDDPVSRSVVKAGDLCKVIILGIIAAGLAAAILLDWGPAGALGQKLAGILSAFRQGDWL